jgi:hypothetical protein
VGAVHSAFYEVFDHLGPQLRWWMWNQDNKNNHPFFEAVPMGSVTLFAALAPAASAFFVHLLVGRKVQRGERIGRGGCIWRVVAVGVLVPVVQIVAGIPVGILDGNTAAQAAVLAVGPGVIWLVAIPALVAGWRQERRHPTAGPNWFVQVFGTVYLVIFAVLWGTALPDFLDAADGITHDGTRVGSLPFAVATYLAGCAFVAAAGTRPARAEPTIALSPHIANKRLVSRRR